MLRDGSARAKRHGGGETHIYAHKRIDIPPNFSKDPKIRWSDSAAAYGIFRSSSARTRLRAFWIVRRVYTIERTDGSVRYGARATTSAMKRDKLVAPKEHSTPSARFLLHKDCLEPSCVNIHH
jgi:hypothetical protein